MSTKRKPKCPHTAGHICNTFMPCDEKCPYFSSKACKNAWQTLKAAVLAQQTNNSAMDAIAICQQLSRFDDTSDMCPESLARLIRGARKLQRHQ